MKIYVVLLSVFLFVGCIEKQSRIDIVHGESYYSVVVWSESQKIIWAKHCLVKDLTPQIKKQMDSELLVKYQLIKNADK